MKFLLICMGAFLSMCYSHDPYGHEAYLEDFGIPTTTHERAQGAVCYDPRRLLPNTASLKDAEAALRDRKIEAAIAILEGFIARQLRAAEPDFDALATADEMLANIRSHLHQQAEAKACEVLRKYHVGLAESHNVRAKPGFSDQLPIPENPTYKQ